MPAPAIIPHRDFAAVAVWLACGVSLIALAGFGPHLWASQVAENPAFAPRIVAIGLTSVFVLGLPVFACRNRTSRIAIILSAPAFVLIGAMFEPPRVVVAIEIPVHVGALFALLSTIWVGVTRWPRVTTLTWLVAVIATFVPPAIGFLTADFGDGAGRNFHFSLLDVPTSTFFH